MPAKKPYNRIIFIPHKSAFFLVVSFTVTLLSCGRLKKDTHQAVDKGKQAIAEKKAELVDKIIQHYDPYHPDTKFNKKRFAEFFGFEPTADVKNIYCYADEMGIDHDYQFAFHCDTATVNRIVSNLQLTDTGVIDHNNGGGFWHIFPWWDSTRLQTLKPFSKKGEHATYWYLWYDSPNQQAYYFAFDM